ncbi:MAG: 16S rRNA (adenine(1518)-N(6)/adenine(1519)-N(6))-dimethyltransferase RsmA [Candidatus Uhrbacteria bacterium]|nr:16S rRNA (adenine(1518)-N(6)/adenine(1519)-N(6))-dimethyltransferase RsmA [Candidatus Uhrbacteria bacterium]
MTPSEIKKVLSDLGARPNKKLGQHFLIDKNVLATIVETAAIKPGDRVLEVGPGLGVLTNALIKQGAEVTAIERDRGMAEYLSGRGEPMRSPSGRPEGRHMGLPLQIIHGDAAKLDWHELMDDRPWKFISNLPYSITSLVLRKALWTENPPTKIVVLVQREVAERAVTVAVGAGLKPAPTRKTSLLSLMVALASSSARIIKRVPPGAFYPSPKVESAILEIIPMTVEERQKKWGMDPEKIMEVAKKGFAHPRKFLFTNLGIKFDLPLIRGIEGVGGFSTKIRAEDLSPENWAKLAILINENAIGSGS